MTGRSTDPDHAAARAQAIAEALGRLGATITEAQAREFAAGQDCDCQEGMFALAPTRRGLLGGAGLVAAVNGHGHDDFVYLYLDRRRLGLGRLLRPFLGYGDSGQERNGNSTAQHLILFYYGGC